MVDEIDYLVKNYKMKNIRIADDIFTFKPERVSRLCDLIIERKYDLNIWCYSRVDTVNKAILEKMRKAGITWVCYGIEAGHERVREGVFKKLSTEKIKKGVQMTKDAGINIIANFVFGLPDDDTETMQATLDMAKGFNFEYVNFYVAMAWPGSQLYRYAVDNKLRLPQTWAGFAQLSEEALPLPTKYVTASEVLKFRDRAFTDYFSNPSYLDMMRAKFGTTVAENIKRMLTHSLKRKYA